MPAPQTYKQLVIDDIRARIASGEYPPGAKLPSTKDLEAQYHPWHRNTIRAAIEYLKATGELTGHQGRGVFVANLEP